MGWLVYRFANYGPREGNLAQFFVLLVLFLVGVVCGGQAETRVCRRGIPSTEQSNNQGPRSVARPISSHSDGIRRHHGGFRGTDRPGIYDADVFFNAADLVVLARARCCSTSLRGNVLSRLLV